MAYRVEQSETNRAGCQDSFCKKNAVKILKGELRLGTLVEIMGNTSLRFKHWGCVSGFQLQNLRESMQESKEVPADGEYNWDFFDGLSDLPQNLQDKVKTAVREGKIADEDFKGDPEFNRLGAKGIRGRPKMQKPAEDKNDEENVESSTTSKKSAVEKRGRTKKVSRDSDDDQEDAKPIKKRAKKVKKEEGAEADAQNDIKSQKKRRRPSKKEDLKEEPVDDEAVAPPANKTNGKGKQVAKNEEYDVKKEESDVKKEESNVEKEESDVKKEKDTEDIADIKSARKSRIKKVVPKSEPEDSVKLEGDLAKDIKPAKQLRGKRAVKNEESQGGPVKMENIAEADMDAKNAGDNANAKDIKSRKTSRSKNSAPSSTRLEDVKMENIPEFNAEISKMEDDDSKSVTKSRENAIKKRNAIKEDGTDTKLQSHVLGIEDRIGDNEVAMEEESVAAAPPVKTARKGQKAPVMATAANSRPRRGKAA